MLWTMLTQEAKIEKDQGASPRSHPQQQAQHGSSSAASPSQPGVEQGLPARPVQVRGYGAHVLRAPVVYAARLKRVTSGRTAAVEAIIDRNTSQVGSSNASSRTAQDHTAHQHSLPGRCLAP